MELQLLGSKAKSKKIDVSETVFGCDFNEALIHQVVVSYLAAGRAGTRAQKNRAAVSGGGIKPWKQKGGGRARAGTIRSPIWRKGGVTFAAQPQCHATKVNKKMYRGAMRSILSELARQDRLNAIENFELATPKTKDLLAKLTELKGVTNRTLIIADSVDNNVYLAARNLLNVDVRDVAAVDPAALVGAEKVLITTAALKQYEEMLK